MSMPCPLCPFSRRLGPHLWPEERAYGLQCETVWWQWCLAPSYIGFVRQRIWICGGESRVWWLSSSPVTHQCSLQVLQRESVGTRGFWEGPGARACPVTVLPTPHVSGL